MSREKAQIGTLLIGMFLVALGGFHVEGPKPTIYVFTMDGCVPCEVCFKETAKGTSWLSLMAPFVLHHDGLPYRKVEYLVNADGGFWALDGDWRKSKEGGEIYDAFLKTTGHKGRLTVPLFWAGGKEYKTGYP